ncbi:MAG: pyridoxamine 5'-phosphate oxidase family protein [Ilumatobacteraceae bacterium]
MSIIVGIPELASAVAQRPWGYLLTVGPDLRVHALAVATALDDGVFRIAAGRSTCSNAAERPEVTVVFPPLEDGGMSLIVDGTADVEGTVVCVRPTGAVLHRAAPV